MGYVIAIILSLISGYIICAVINRERKKRYEYKAVKMVDDYIEENEKVVKEILDNTKKEMNKIKEEMGKEPNEKRREKIIKNIDDYFEYYGYSDSGDSG